MLLPDLEHKLRKAFSPIFLEITDESHLHEGHAGFKEEGESHFSLVIISDTFCGLTRLQRHQRVYDCLRQELKIIHALRMKVLCPGEEGALSAIEPVDGDGA